jgi:hypothetical protein
MSHCNHLTYRGKVYRLEVGSSHTLVPFTSAETYIDQLMTNPSVGPYIVDHDVRLKKLLGNADNPVCEEVVIDYDLIEVRNGACPLWSTDQSHSDACVSTLRRVSSNNIYCTSF